MKKLFLSLATLCVAAGASASTELEKVWNASVDGAYKADAKVYAAEVAVDAEGNTIVSGAYSDDLTLGGTTLAATGESAYLAKYDAIGTILWAVGFEGSASVTAIDTDADGNIYVAGTLADEVVFGTTSGTPVTKDGLKMDDAYTTKENASFIAKYNAAGVLQKVENFVPYPNPDLMETFMYYPEDGDIFFRINHLQVEGGKVYASAIYTDFTKIGDITFKAYYNDPWGGIYFVQMKSAAVFSLDAELANCAVVATCGLEAPIATDDDQYSASSVSFTANSVSVYVAFSGNGPLHITAEKDNKTLTATADKYNYIFCEVKNGSLAQCETYACPEAGFNTTFVPASLFVSGSDLLVVGYESFAENYEAEGERIGSELFAFAAPLDNLAIATKTVKEDVQGDVTYYEVTSAALIAEGEVLLNAAGYYNATKEVEGQTLYRNGDFAGSVKSLTFLDGSFADATVVENAIAVASNGDFSAFGSFGETGNAYALYKVADTGVEGVEVENDAEAVYFNLQGVKVSNPEKGIYVVSKGGKTSKVVVK